MIDDLRVKNAPEMVRVVLAIDPAVTSGENADETGIVVAGRAVDGHAYVLCDLSCRLTSDGWARRAVEAYKVAANKSRRLSNFDQNFQRQMP